MTSSVADIRPDEQRATWVAFATLLLVVAGHVLLETARDALFLARLPAAQLPFTYLGIAALSVVFFSVAQRRGRTRASARGLSLGLSFSAVVTLVFWFLVDPARPVFYHALYLWSALSSTLLVSRFWTLVARRFDIGQARRVFPVVTLGGIVGAVVGSLLAGFIATEAGAARLLPVAAGIHALAAILPGRFLRRRPPRVEGGGDPSAETMPEDPPLRTLRRIHRDPYLRRVGVLLLLSTFSFTLVDYLFKATAAARIPPDQLGSFFARAYLAMNVCSLVAQLLLVRYLVALVRRFKIDQLLSALPALVLLGAGAFGAGFGLAASFALKAVDGTLRYSLHRTSTEMLFVPIEAARRPAIKGMLDALSQRGGQALASVSILGLAAFSGSLLPIAVAMALGAFGWMWAARSILPPYLGLFRRALTEGSHASRLDYPQMDLASLESLLRSLNSTDDGEVTAAIDLLAEKARVDLLPGLILYHPSATVVLRALSLFAEVGREDVIPLLDRLHIHEDPTIRAAALRARFRLGPDVAAIGDLESDPSPFVRATSLVGQTFLGREEARRTVEYEAAHGSEEVRLALALAIRYSPDPRFDPVLVTLARSPRLAVRATVAEAMREIGSPTFVPSLLVMLKERDLRAEARRALVAIGDPALTQLESTLANRWVDPRVRKHLPRSIHRFANQRAVDILLGSLPRETDPVVEHKILRALGRLARERTDLVYGAETLFAVTLAKLRTAYRFLEYGTQVRSGRTANPAFGTPGHDLLLDLLSHKHELAIEHAFRLLGIANRALGEDFREIYRGLRSGSRQKRASGRELLENLLRPPLREPLLLLLDELPADAILARATTFFRPTARTYEAVLEELLAIEETGVRCIVVYHVGELGLLRLLPVLEALPSDRDGLVARSVETARARMGVVV